MMCESRFLKIGRVSGVGDDFFSCVSAELGGRPHELLEAMAQCAAYHVRYLTDFNRQAFLLKVAAAPVLSGGVTGRVHLTATLTGVSRDARAYNVTAKWRDQEICASLLIGTTPYNDKFEGKRLSPYYQEIFACLMND